MERWQREEDRGEERKPIEEQISVMVSPLATAELTVQQCIKTHFPEKSELFFFSSRSYFLWSMLERGRTIYHV